MSGAMVTVGNLMTIRIIATHSTHSLVDFIKAICH